jgi:hypothetical protein
MVHVSAGPPTIPDGGIAPGRFCPWPPDGRLPIPCEASVLTHRHPYPLWCAATGAPWFPGPTMSGSSWSCHGPRAPVPVHGDPVHAMMSRTMSAGIPPPASLLRAQAPVRNPPAAAVGPSDSGSVQVAVRPCWEQDLPDVLSAPLSRRAWTPTPVALEVLLPVASLKTAAFPSCGPGRRSTMSVQRLQHGALCEAAVLR